MPPTQLPEIPMPDPSQYQQRFRRSVARWSDHDLTETIGRRAGHFYSYELAIIKAEMARRNIALAA
jgi:hypothetical protein